MERWKKKILKEIYKQWMSKEQVSADDIIRWLNNPENNLELYCGVLNCLYESWYFRYYIRFVGWLCRWKVKKDQK